MGNGESSLGEDWNTEDYEDMTEKANEYNRLADENAADAQHSLDEQVKAAKEKFEAAKEKVNLNLDKVVGVESGTFSKVDWKNWETDPGITPDSKQAIINKLNDVAGTAKLAFKDTLSGVIKDIGGDPDKLFKVTIDPITGEATPSTPADAENAKKVTNELKSKFGTKVALGVMSLIFSLASIVGTGYIGLYLFDKFEHLLGCPSAKSGSGCFAIDPNSKDREKVMFSSGYGAQCTYDILCGDGSSGSGCDKGQATQTTTKCCSGIADAQCGTADSSGKCIQQGSEHYGWSYTAICEDAGQGVADMFANLGSMLESAVKWIFIVIGGLLAAMLAYVAIKFLLAHVSMGESKQESSHSSEH